MEASNDGFGKDLDRPCMHHVQYLARPAEKRKNQAS
jgi:hypothetical protein